LAWEKLLLADNYSANRFFSHGLNAKNLFKKQELKHIVRMKRLTARGAVAFTVPVLIAFGLAFHSKYFFLTAGPLCGIVGGMAYGRRWGLPLVLGTAFGLTGGLLTVQQDVRSALFTDIVWVGLVFGFTFWCIGACAVLVLPAKLRFRGALAFAIPGALAGMVFQFLYGPGYFLFNLSSRSWWGQFPWEHLAFWLIAGAGIGWLLGAELERTTTRTPLINSWAIFSVACAGFGLVTAIVYFRKYRLPLGLFNSISPSSVASDWMFGWAVLAGFIGVVALMKQFGRRLAATGVVLAFVLMFASYRVEAGSWRTRFDTNYAQLLLREHGQADDPQYGNTIYTANVIFSLAALEKNDIAGAKTYLFEAVSAPNSQTVEQIGLDTSVVQILLQRGERDTVLEYFKRGRHLWPLGGGQITRWENFVRAGRTPNFNNKG
jgi:hypothetical protein